VTTPATGLTSSRPSGSDPLAVSLAPVRRALLDDAEADAARLVAEATSAATDRVTAAREGAERAVAEARRRARQTARARAEQDLGSARREAHAILLRSETGIWEDVVDELHRAIRTMPSDPRYPALLDRLAALAHEQLGDAATVERDPDGGGVVATHAGRRVDYRLSALADRVLDSISDEVTELWR
jgi:vacuolar-type H+-ATPase subunit E/Vma4